MAIENLPKDPMMLLSFVNTRLRDDGINLDSFCLQFRTAREDLEQKLAAVDYKYDDKLNRFVYEADLVKGDIMRHNFKVIEKKWQKK